MVEIKEKGSTFSEMEYKFYVVFVSHASIEDNVNVKNDHDYPRMYLRVMHIVEFDTFTATHGPGTYVDGKFYKSIYKSHILNNRPFLESSGSKRKLSSVDGGPPAKQQKTIYPAYFVPELAHVVAMCDEKLPFVALAQELAKRKIPHSGLQVEANATSLVLKLLTLPEPSQSSANTPEQIKVCDMFVIHFEALEEECELNPRKILIQIHTRLIAETAFVLNKNFSFMRIIVERVLYMIWPSVN